MSDLVQVKIKGMVMTAQYGTLTSGTILRTNAAFGKHLVEECGAAEYVKQEAPAANPVAAAKRSTGKKKDSQPALVTVATTPANTTAPAESNQPDAVNNLAAQIAALESQLAKAPDDAKAALEEALSAAKAAQEAAGTPQG